MGTLQIPRQAFPTEVRDLTGPNAIGHGLTSSRAVAEFNTKEFLFEVGKNPRAVGDISAFRHYLYPIYDAALQSHLLQKSDGKPARCPFARIHEFIDEVL